MIRKFVLVLGILSALVAIEGLYRFGSLVGITGSVFDFETDSDFYFGFGIVYLLIAGFMLVSIFKDFFGARARVLKYLLVLLGGLSFLLMLGAPAVPVAEEISVAMLVSLVALFFVEIVKYSPDDIVEQAITNARYAPAANRQSPERETRPNWINGLKVVLGLFVSAIIFVSTNFEDETDQERASATASNELIDFVFSGGESFQPTYEVGEVFRLGEILVRIDRVRTFEFAGSELLEIRANSGATYFSVEYSFKNEGSRQLPATLAPDVIVRDADQNWFAPSPSPTNLEKSHLLLNSLYSGGAFSGDPINPGVTYKDIVVFELSKDRLDASGWRIAVAVEDNESLIRFMRPSKRMIEREPYFAEVSEASHSPTEVAELAAQLYGDSLFPGANCCEVTITGQVPASGEFSCPSNASAYYFEYEYDVCGREGCTNDVFGICVPERFNNVADLVLVSEQQNGESGKDLSLNLEVVIEHLRIFE